MADNVEIILALEALAAAQGIDLLAPLRPGPQTAKAHALIRARVPTLEDDRAFGLEIEAARALVHEGELAGIAARALEVARP